MQFGYFDDGSKEYVITRPDTPRPWSNYLGSTEYGAIITNNAGGYSFFKSAAQGRFTRLRFNSIPLDQPGRYVYIHDRDSRDFWSTSWQPVGKSLRQYKSECRHGTAYTKISSDYSDIKSETLFFVPLGRDYECWHLKLTNTGRRRRRLSLFTYVEYANNWKLSQDQNNLQYSQFIVKMDVVDGIIDHGTNVNMPVRPDHFEDDGQARHTFLAVAGAKVVGYDTDRDTFLGPYGTYARPLVVAEGKSRNSVAVGDNACGALQVDIDLKRGESKEITILMGIGSAGVEGKNALRECGKPAQVRKEFDKLKKFWHGRIEGLAATTPDAELNSMLAVWNPFNCLMTFAWSRAASLVYAGERDGLGYRDTVQDMLGVLHLIPDEVKERLELMITGQVSTGGAMPVVKPFAHKPGAEKPPEESEYRSDDCMWLFNTVPAYVKETGDLSFFDKVLPYADSGEDTVLGHLKRAIEFSLKRSGSHGFPCGLAADWNDCVALGQDGETVFVAFQLRYALATYIDICTLLNKLEEVIWAVGHLKTLDENLDKYAWDGEWYTRAFRADGVKYGSKENNEASIFLEPQPWAVISKHGSPERWTSLMDVVGERLGTDYGLMILAPPIVTTDPQVNRSRLFNPGMKENASIFCHTQGWAIIAETLIGRGDRAYDYYRRFMPAAYNTKAEVRQIEPYVYCQFTNSKYSPRYGASRLPWLSGSATWAYYTISQFILGVQPDYAGIRLDPCIPSDWKEIRITRIFRRKTLGITIRNPHGVQKGVKSIKLNGQEINGNLIPVERLQEKNSIVVVMG
jgi:N,N'-diacetylchitobiose phosphorylase